MVTIGYLDRKKKPPDTGRAYALAAAAKAEGAQLLYFNPLAADFENRKINGYVYNDGGWEKTTNAFPDVIYNQSGSYSERQACAVDRLRDEIPFIGNSIGSKPTVFRNLARFGKFTDYLATTDSESLAGHPYPGCRTRAGAAYVIRLHTQKNAKGEWETVQIYPRISPNGDAICDTSVGGYTADPETFFKLEFENQYDIHMLRLDEFAVMLSSHLDWIQNELYGEELDELGIDIGIDESRNIRIYDIGWRPESPPHMCGSLTIEKNLVGYAKYLAAK